MEELRVQLEESKRRAGVSGGSKEEVLWPAIWPRATASACASPRRIEPGQKVASLGLLAVTCPARDSLTRTLVGQEAAAISAVLGGAASKYGDFLPGDVVIGLNGCLVQSARQVEAELQRLRPGHSLQVLAIRDGKPLPPMEIPTETRVLFRPWAPSDRPALGSKLAHQQADVCRGLDSGK